MNDKSPAVPDAPDPRADWHTSAARQRVIGRYYIGSMSGVLLIYAGIASLIVPSAIGRRLDVGQSVATLISIAITAFGFGLVVWGFSSVTGARARFYEAQEREARGEVDQALSDVKGPEDLIGLMRANRKQMDAYDALARSQAQTSYRSSQAAMACGLALLAVGVLVAIFADSDSSKYAAAAVTTVGAATGGYITKTFLTAHRSAGEQMNFYFQQPLVQSYLLSAERLMIAAAPEERAVLRSAIVNAALEQMLNGRRPGDPDPGEDSTRI